MQYAKRSPLQQKLNAASHDASLKHLIKGTCLTPKTNGISQENQFFSKEPDLNCKLLTFDRLLDTFVSLETDTFSIDMEEK